MTRINVVPPRELSDKHLVAEYRELPRVFGLADRWVKRGKDTPIPKAYTMGAGHVAFFYDKLHFITARYIMLVDEMRRRGFEVRFANPRVVPDDPTIFRRWRPTKNALAINRQRIKERGG